MMVTNKHGNITVLSHFSSDGVALLMGLCTLEKNTLGGICDRPSTDQFCSLDPRHFSTRLVRHA